MAEQLYNQFADISALEAQRDTILKQIFGKIKEGVIDLSKTTFKIDGASSAADLKKVLEELKVKEKELTEQSKKLAETQSQMALLMQQTASGVKGQAEGFKGLSDQMQVNIQRQIQLKDRLADIKEALGRLDEFREAAKDSAQFNEEIVKLTAEQAQLKQELSATNKLINNQVKEFNAASGSIDEQRAKINQLQQVYDSLSQAQRETDDGKKLLAQIQTLDVELKKLEGDTGRFQRSVGDYANKLAGGFERVAEEIRKLKTEQGSLANLKAANPIGFKVGGGEERLNQINGALQQLNATAQIGFQTTGNLNQQVRQLEKSYQNMAVSGAQSNEFLEEFKHFVAQSKDQLEDLRGEIKALSSDTFVFDQISQGVKFLAASGQIALSVMELVGDKNEDVQKSIQRLIIIQNVANGVQEIANQLTARGTILNKAYVFVQNLVTLSLNSSATAAARFSAALGLIGIAATVIGAAVIAIAAYKRATDNAATSAGVLRKTLADSNNEYTDAIKNVNQLKINIGLAKDGFLNKKDVVKQYNETIGKTTGEVKNLDEAEQELNKNAEAYIKFTLAKAAAQLALGKAANEALLLAQKEQDLEQDLTLATKATRKPIKLGATDAGEAADEGTEGEKRVLAERNRVREQSNKRIKNFEDIANEFQTQAALLATKFKFNFFGDGGGDSKDNNDAAKKFFSAGLEFQRDALMKISEDEKKFISERIAARKAAADIEARIVFGKTKDEIAAAKGNAEQIANIRESEGIELSRIAIKRNDDILKLQEGFYKGMLDRVVKGEEILKEAKKQFAEQQITDAEGALGQSNLGIENFYDQQNQDNEIAFKRGRKSAEQYAADKKKIQSDLNKALLQSEIVYTQDIINIRKLQGADTTEDERKLLKLKQSLRDADVDNYEEYAKRMAEINKKLVDDRKAMLDKLGDQLKDSFFNILAGVFDGQINKIRDQIDAIEKLKAAEIDHVNSSTDGEEKKAARIKIIEAKAQTDREALDRRQRSIERNKAIIERASTAFTITIGGIKDVARIKSAAAAAYANAMATIPPPYNVIAAVAAQINVLKEIPFSIASTTAALAGVLATPIPKFYTGKNVPLTKQQKDNYAGNAIVGDGGKKEIIIREDGKVQLTPATPTLTTVKKNDIILPDAKKAMPSILEKMRPLPMYKTGKHVQAFEKFKESIKESIVTNNVDSSSTTEKDRQTIQTNPPSTQVKRKDPIRSEPKKAGATIIESVIPLPIFKADKQAEEFERIKESIESNTSNQSKITNEAITNNTSNDHLIHISEMKIIKGASPVSTTYSDNENANTRVNKPVYNYTSLSELANLKDQTTYNISNDMIRANELERKQLMHSYNTNVNVSVPENKELLEKTDSMISEMKQLNKKPFQFIIHNEKGIESSAWFQQHFKN